MVLRPDGSFDYMLAYGAADYFARGTWRVKDGAVILSTETGTQKPPFSLVNSVSNEEGAIRVRVVAPNGRPVPNIDAALFIEAGGGSQARTDSDGCAWFAPDSRANAAAFSIRVYQIETAPFQLNPAHNDFTFEINGDAIRRVPFQDERLAIEADALLMTFWGEEAMRYEKD
jgi:hypothetical protein